MLDQRILEPERRREIAQIRLLGRRVRLDRDRVVACLAPALGAVSQTMGSSRLMVSFRFALRAAD